MADSDQHTMNSIYDLLDSMDNRLERIEYSIQILRDSILAIQDDGR